MANGNIKVSTDVLAKFSELFSVSLDYHLGTQSDHSDIEVLPKHLEAYQSRIMSNKTYIQSKYKYEEIGFHLGYK